MINKQRKDILRSLLFVFVFGLCLLQAQDAFAQASGALFDSGTSFLTALSNLLTSTWARIIGIIAVAVLGFMYMLGRVSMQVTIAVVVGIVMVFGAPAIVDSVASVL
ncbi:MAG: TrbC/VirB2 family protein [Alphaproteobacteria bacterium]|nr:TrbC/VirB2 family protein [Alphaproteobacteria bacterium]